MGYTCTDGTWPGRLQHEVEEMLRHLEEAEEDPDWEGTTPSGEVYCGCETCSIREILTVAVDRTVEAVAAGILVLDKEQ